MEVSGQLHVPGALPRPHRLQYPQTTRLGGLQTRSGRFGGQKDPVPLPQFKTRTLQPVALSLY
jgi:hypothetical protein